MNIIFIVFLVITFDAFLFLNQQKKYRGYLTLKHYAEPLKMPIYQKVLMFKIIIVVFFSILINSFL